MRAHVFLLPRFTVIYSNLRKQMLNTPKPWAFKK